MLNTEYYIKWIIFPGVTQSDNLWVSGTGVDLIVKPGSNVTIYCDCIWTTGLKIYWYRNCLQCRKPSIAISTQDITLEDDKSFPHYQAKVNSSSQSHDLLIKNITESELGVYYCCVVEPLVIDNNDIKMKYFHRFGNITYKLSFDGKTLHQLYTFSYID